MTQINPMFMTDFYKVSHRTMYQEGTTHTVINMTARSSKYATKLEGVDDSILLVGVQSFEMELHDMFYYNFFGRHITDVVSEYKKVIKASLGVDDPDVSHIIQLHVLGYLPLRITSLEEGKLVPIKVPFIQIVNTDPRFAWLPTYIETYMSSYLWQIITNATVAFNYRVLFERAAKKDGTDPFSVKIQGHDFSMRGLATPEASRNGIGHLASFLGTDTIPAIVHAMDYYFADGMVGCSVPASEHSVMTQRGKEGEEDVFKHIIGKAYPTGIVSVVADSYNLWNFIDVIMMNNKDLIMNRQNASNGLPAKVVVRPDSGDPVQIITGLTSFKLEDYDPTEEFLVEQEYDVVEHDGKYYTFYVDYDGGWDYRFNYHVVLNKEVSVSEVKGVVEMLWDNFGGTVNDKGYKVLNSHVGVIYGDSITLDRAKQIIERLHQKGFASGNVVYGIGSYTYQMNSSDTYGMAVKSTATRVVDENGAVTNRAIFKDPITDDGTKRSARGLLAVEEIDGEIKLKEIEQFDLLEYAEGKVDTGLLKEQFRTSFDMIRSNVDKEVSRFI